MPPLSTQKCSVGVGGVPDFSFDWNPNRFVNPMTTPSWVLVMVSKKEERRKKER